MAPSNKLEHWALGPVYSSEREFSEEKLVAGFRRAPGLLDDQGNDFERMKISRYKSPPLPLSPLTLPVRHS